MSTRRKYSVTGVLSACVFAVLCSNVQAQDAQFRDQAWRFGLHLGMNYNSASLGYQNLHAPFPNFDKPNTTTEENVNGNGWGGYGGMFVEYLSEDWWGVQLRVSYDMRDAVVKDIYATPNTEFDTRMSYMLFEPSIRIDQHLIPNLSLTAGPLVAVNIHGRYDYRAVAGGPVTDDNVKTPDRSVASLGLGGGVAYDIEIGRTGSHSVFLSPFFDYSWVAAQRKSVLTSAQNSTTDIWSTQTFRFGLRLSWEYRHVEKAAMTEIPQRAIPMAVVEIQKKRVSCVMPVNNRIVAKNVTGYFPVLPYMFFDKGRRSLPARYIVLTPAEAQSFSEVDLGSMRKGDLTVRETNVNQLMVTYCNVANIYGDRMRKNPNVQLILVGSDPVDVDGNIYANTVKTYLVSAFGIAPNRIKIEITAPRKPSGSSLTDPAFSDLIDDENRRVAFMFDDDAMYRPVPYTIRDESSIDNDMVFSINETVPLGKWSVSVSGKNGTMDFGPFSTHSERINPAPLMRGLDDGQFTANIVMTLQDGQKATESIDFKLNKVKETRNASRYLMVFDYNKSDPVLAYETKIRKEITPGMNVGNTVIVHGHTDIIGNEEENQILSQRRSDQAKRIVDDELGKESKVVDVQSIGVGQTVMPYTFENKYPEGRMYNRNVFVEIIQ